MYRQRPFAVDDQAWCRDLARDHAFATVVAAPGGHAGPARIGHVPIVVKDEELSFHVATDNPLADVGVGEDVVFVFVGPHAHVSASWYADPARQVPTWNYEAVHATGRVVEVLDRSASHGHVTEVATTFEGPDGWSVHDAPEHTDRLLPGLRAFRVEVSRWEGVAKLSQNRSTEDRLRVGVHLRQSADSMRQRVGERVLEEVGDTPTPTPSLGAGGFDAPPLDRFTLRMPNADDEELFLAAVAASHHVFDGWVEPPETPEAFAEWLGKIDPDHNRRMLALHEDQVIGLVNLQNIIHGHGRYATLGYLAFDGGQGRGLMRRAVALGVDIAFDEVGLHRVEAGIQPTNTRSLALVRALGFRYEGLLKRLVEVDGAFRDHELWATDTEDWPGAAAIFAGPT